MNRHISIEELKFFDHEYTPIELMGLAKNHIVQAKELIDHLPVDYTQKLSHAYALLHEVQEYLYEH